MKSGLRILMPSIVDPDSHTGGAGTVTRGLIELLEGPPLNARVECFSAQPSNAAAHRWRQGSALAKASIRGIPAKHAFLQTGKFQTAVAEAAKDPGVELAVINGGDLVWIREHLPDHLPVVLVAHNIEHELYASQLEAASSRLAPLKPFLQRDLARLEQRELEALRDIDAVIYLSPADATYARGQGARGRHLTVPPLFVGPQWRRGPAPTLTGPAFELSVGLLANFSWWPNRLGLRWFVDRVLPFTSDRVRLHLVGTDSAGAVPVHSRITAHGYVSDLSTVCSDLDLMIGPVKAGGGTKVKLAEALYHQVPVLATSFAMTGLPVIDDPSVVVADQAEEWVTYLNGWAEREEVPGKVSPEVSAKFAASTHRKAVSDFIAAVCT